MSGLGPRITRLEMAVAGAAVGCDTCRSWPTARERVLSLVVDDVLRRA